MYQSDDFVNDIPLKDCFKNLIELAWETRLVDEDLANKFFDILVECLGVDFRISFDDMDKNLTSAGNVAHLILNNFKSAEAGVNNIEALFNSFPYMVQEGKFSKEYYAYLLSRRAILDELMKYQGLKVNQATLNREAELAKYATLSNDLVLVDRRIHLVEANLAMSR